MSQTTTLNPADELSVEAREFLLTELFSRLLCDHPGKWRQDSENQCLVKDLSGRTVIEMPTKECAEELVGAENAFTESMVKEHGIPGAETPKQPVQFFQTKEDHNQWRKN